MFRNLPDSAALYSALLMGRVASHIHFSRIDGKLQIAGIAVR
jgi:hypothetical protein